MTTKVLFDSTKGKKLEECPIIKCAVGEKILCVQRQHPIVLFNKFALSIITFLILLAFLILIPNFLPETLSILFKPAFFIYIMLIGISLFLLIITFVFMNWYYQFYVITNKAIIHRHCFRIGGEYSEVVFGEKMHVQDMVRIPQNVIYDFLKIQDVYVYFHKLEREEPFIFKTPQDAQVIEDLIQDLVTQANHTKGKT